MFARSNSRRVYTAMGLAAVVALSACSGTSKVVGPAKTTLPATPATTAPTTTVASVTPATSVTATSVVTTPTAAGAITSIDDVKSATVQVLAQGSYRDPEVGAESTFGSGSGFIIDSSGIVVTNNHVVTGAGAIELLIGGSTETVPAKILGVSECSDLAVLQIVDPGPYPYLTWFQGDVAPPTEVYAAGFPLGDPEFTITKGIVSKAKADGDTSWASVRSVIEQDAAIQPGNSGGPLVNAKGELIGINYAGGDPGTGTSQFFAISRDIAEPMVEKLKKGNAETIGVNGKAFVDDAAGLAGVWVGAVTPGSPAAKAGLAAGDIITSLNGVQLSSGTMKEYCDVLRSAQDGAAIGIEIIRYDTQTGLAGELNGTPLAETFSFAQAAENDVPKSDVVYDYETVTDDTGSISVAVPTVWTDRTTGTQDLGLNSGPVPAIQASPDLADPAQPSMALFQVTGFTGITPNAILDSLAQANCTEISREDYFDPISGGRFSTQTCDDGSVFLAIVANPVFQPDKIVLLTMFAFSDADLVALDKAAATFSVF